MTPVATTRFIRAIWAFLTVLMSWAAVAAIPQPISKYFPVCMKPIPGVTYSVRVGIDAAEGKFVGQGGTIGYMVSHNPNLPPSVAPSVLEQRLTESLRLLALVDGALGIYGEPKGHGSERLYGLSEGDLPFPNGAVQQTVFVQLWSDSQKKNVRLLRKVGDALYSCQK